MNWYIATARSFSNFFSLFFSPFFSADQLVFNHCQRNYTCEYCILALFSDPNKATEHFSTKKHFFENFSQRVHFGRNLAIYPFDRSTTTHSPSANVIFNVVHVSPLQLFSVVHPEV